LRTVEFVTPSSLRRIRSGAFWYCIGLEAIDLPSAVFEIGRRSFENCGSLRVFVQGEARMLTCIGEHAFRGCPLWPELEISGTIRCIGVSAFPKSGRIVWRQPHLLVGSAGLVARTVFSGCAGLGSATARPLGPFI
jgi:hypothetical protein